MHNIVIFGDDLGIPQLIKYFPSDYKIFTVAASIRPLPKTFNPDFIQPVKHQPSYSNFVETLCRISPDFIFSHSYSMFLPEEILAIPTHGAINTHFAYLPNYRGANPIQWAIINGAMKTGVTLHYMINEIDAGDIIAQCEVPILITDTWVNVTRKCVEATDKLFEINIPAILNGTNTRRSQTSKPPTRFPRRKPEDGHFAWNESAISIHNKIRALVKPLPGAFYYDNINGVRTKIVVDEYKSLDWVKRMKIKMGYQ